MVTVTASGGRVAEGDSSYETLTFTIQLDDVATEQVAVPWRLISGAAQGESDTDYTGGSYTTGIAYFSPGTTLKEVPFYPAGDIDAEPDESVILEILRPDGAQLSGNAVSSQVVGWIVDDDGFATPRSLFVSSPIVMEGDSGGTQITFDLELSRPADRDYSIPYALGGSATPGEDYADKSGTVVFATGQSRASITVRIDGDRELEGLEFVDLLLDLPSGIEESRGGRATIVDDDAGPGPYVLIDGASVGELDSSYGTMTFSVTLTEPSSEQVAVPWRVSTGTVDPGSDTDYTGGSYSSGTVYFRPGEMQKTVLVYPAGDTEAEPDETFAVEILTPQNARLPGGTTVSEAFGFVMDDDDFNNPLSMQISNPTVVENDGDNPTASFRLELSRSAPTDLEIEYRTVNGSAKAGRDYVAKTGTVVIKEGQTFGSIGVDVIADNGFEENETFGLQVFLPSAIHQSAGGTATILNEDVVTDVLVIDGTDRSERLKGEPYGDRIDGKGGDDLLIGSGGDDVLLGGDGKDRLKGSGGEDSLNGQEDDDVLLGGGGADTLTGAGGNDTLKGGGGADQMSGGDGDDSLDGGGKGDTLEGGGGADELSGGKSADVLEGQNGNDVLSGGGGVDRLAGGAGNDTLTGGSGEDVFIFQDDGGTDTVTDYDDGRDLIRIDSGASDFRQLEIDQVAEGASVAFGQTTIILLGADADDLGRNDFLF